MDHSIEVNVCANYIADQSRPENHQHVFAYTITITNQSVKTVQLISRQWRITDANDQVQEVQGIGVVGEQPIIPPGKSYTYSSGAVIATETGTMSGFYSMKDEDGQDFDTEIPTFALVRPQALH